MKTLNGVPLEAVLDRLWVVPGPPAGDPNQVSEGERDRHLGEAARAVPRQHFLVLGHHLLVGPPDVEGDLGKISLSFQIMYQVIMLDHILYHTS